MGSYPRRAGQILTVLVRPLSPRTYWRKEQVLAVTLIMAQVAHLAMTVLSGGNRSLKLKQLHIIDLLIQLFGSEWVWTTFSMPWMGCISYTCSSFIGHVSAVLVPPTVLI